MATLITEATVCDAIADTFRTQIPSLSVQSYNQLTDGIPELPLLQVYWWKFIEDATTDSDRAASKHTMTVSDDTYRLDLYAKTRSELREDMPAVMDMLSKMREAFYAQTTTYFGLDAIKSAKWQGQFGLLKYGEPKISYAGARITLTIRIF